MRNYFLLGEAELMRLASLSGLSGRKARAELGRRERLALNLTALGRASERREVAQRQYRERVNALIAKGSDEPPSKPKRKSRGQTALD